MACKSLGRVLVGLIVSIFVAGCGGLPLNEVGLSSDMPQVSQQPSIQGQLSALEELVAQEGSADKVYAQAVHRIDLQIEGMSDVITQVTARWNSAVDAHDAKRSRDALSEIKEEVPRYSDLFRKFLDLDAPQECQELHEELRECTQEICEAMQYILERYDLLYSYYFLDADEKKVLKRLDELEPYRLALDPAVSHLDEIIEHIKNFPYE